MGNLSLVCEIHWIVGIPANRHWNPRIRATSTPTTRQISSYEKMWSEEVFREDENTATKSVTRGHFLAGHG